MGFPSQFHGSSRTFLGSVWDMNYYPLGYGVSISIVVISDIQCFRINNGKCLSMAFHITLVEDTQNGNFLQFDMKIVIC